MEIKKTDQAGMDFLAKEEGLILHPYLDSVGIPTIGIGSTYYPDGRRVQMTDPPLTREGAFELFSTVLETYEKTIWSTTRDDINQHQFNALVSLCFNIGAGNFKKSTVLVKVNINPNDPAIRQAFEMWKNAGGRPILLKRRQREADLYFKSGL